MMENDDAYGLGSRLNPWLDAGTYYVVVAGVGTASGNYVLSRKGPADTTAPATIQNLEVFWTTPNSVTLRWTAPGDDNQQGTAASYEVRASNSAITSEEAWDAAWSVPWVPVPSEAGTVQTFTVTGLSQGMTHWFAIRASDEVPLRGSPSNTVSATLQSEQDAVAPAGIVDIVVTGATWDTVTLTWTAPGDDGSTGVASGYTIKVSTQPILTDAAFDAASFASEFPQPVPAGSLQTVTIHGLSPSTTYYFAVKANDGVNTGALSNSPSVRTAAP